jgi:transcriptional regulator GlxA family with amidase domain
MQRRRFLASSLTALSIARFAAATGAAADGRLPDRKKVRVAFLLGVGANVIDTCGPWEVFQDTMVGDRDVFELFTVAPQRELVRMTGGLEVMPTHSLKDAPRPHVVVVPAQKSDPEALRWLAEVSPATDVTVSVCTGAFQLARAGLLKGRKATTHHDFQEMLAKEFPDVEVQQGQRFVDNGRIATAGGLTSGIDLALHVVERYFGREVADTTATYMEYTRH